MANIVLCEIASRLQPSFLTMMIPNMPRFTTFFWWIDNSLIDESLQATALVKNYVILFFSWILNLNFVKLWQKKCNERYWNWSPKTDE